MTKNDQHIDILTKIIQTVPIDSSNRAFILRMGSIDAMLFTLGKAGGLQILRYQGLAIVYYGFAIGCLGSEVLRLLQR